MPSPLGLSAILAMPILPSHNIAVSCTFPAYHSPCASHHPLYCAALRCRRTKKSCDTWTAAFVRVCYCVAVLTRTMFIHGMMLGSQLASRHGSDCPIFDTASQRERSDIL